MGGRAVLGALLGVVLVAVVVSFARCLPKPEEKIEWLRREDAVIVQMKTVSHWGSRLLAPDFTLYGDGTLIYVRRDASDGLRLLEAHLPPDAIEDLVAFMVHEGFLNFAYEQPSPDGIRDAPTTFLYVNTTSGANAVRAYALGIELPVHVGAEWDQFRRLDEIRERLDEMDPVDIGGRVKGEFIPDAAFLEVGMLEGSARGDEDLPVWPFPTIRLSDVTRASRGGELRVEGELVAGIARAVLQDGQSDLQPSYREGNGAFLVGYRPLLPYEEHFPEFETPE